MSSSDDWDLINRVRREPEALEELFRRHRDYVYRICWSCSGSVSLAEDATQDVFYRLARQRRPLLKRARFRTWLYRVAINVCRDLQRQPRFQPGALDENAADSRARAESQASLEELAQALDQLSERQRSVVSLRVLEGFDCRETAKALNISEGSVKTHLHRGLAKLRELMG